MLVKPIHTVFKNGWTDLRSTPFLTLQKKTSEGNGPSWRILTKIPCVIIATGECQKEIDDDWVQLLQLIRTLKMAQGEDASKLLSHLNETVKTTDPSASAKSDSPTASAPASSGRALPTPVPKARASSEDPAPAASTPAASSVSKPTTRQASPVRALPKPGEKHQPSSPTSSAVPRSLPVAPASKRASVRINPSSQKVNDALAWERNRNSILKDLSAVDTEYRSELERIHEKYAQKVANILKQREVAEAVASRVVKAEKRNFNSVVVSLAGGEKGAVMTALDKEYRLRESVVKIQRAWRLHEFRKNCRDGKKKMAVREKAVREIVSSEEAYVDSLKLLVREYMLPMREKGFVNLQQMKEIFMNVQDILAFNTAFLKKMQQRLTDFDNRKTCVGDLFLDVNDMEELYKRFVSGFDKSTTLQNSLMESSSFCKWQDEISDKPEVKHLRLGALLIMPVQRIPRYMLLLREVLSHTNPDHPDYENLEKGYERMQKIGDSINEAKRRAEANQRLHDLQRQFRNSVRLLNSFRVFIYEGPAAQEGCDGVVGGGVGPRPCYLYLLTDQIIVCPKKNSSSILCRIGLMRASVTELGDDPSRRWEYGLLIHNTGGSFSLYFDYIKEFHAWLKAIQKAIELLPDIIHQYPREEEEAIILSAAGFKTGTPSMGQSSVVRGAAAADSSASLLMLLAKDPGQGQSTERPVFEGKIKDIVNAFNDIARLQEDIIKMPIDIRTLFPEYMVRMHPDHLQYLRGRIDLLGQKLRAIDALNKRASELMVSQKVFHTLNAVIDEGEKPMTAMKTLVVTYFPEDRVAQLNLPKEKNPQFLMRYFMYWYVRLNEAWEAVRQQSWL